MEEERRKDGRCLHEGSREKVKAFVFEAYVSFRHDPNNPNINSKLAEGGRIRPLEDQAERKAHGMKRPFLPTSEGFTGTKMQDVGRC